MKASPLQSLAPVLGPTASLRLRAADSPGLPELHQGAPTSALNRDLKVLPELVQQQVPFSSHKRALEAKTAESQLLRAAACA